MSYRIVTRVLVMLFVSPLVLVSGCVAAQRTWASPSTSQPMLLLLPLAYAATVVAILFTQARTHARRVGTHVAALLIGAAMGLAWRPLVLVLIWGTTSLGFLWLIVTIIGALVGASVGFQRIGGDRHVVGISALCVSAALVSSTAAEPLRSFALGDEYLTITFAVWQPGDQELTVRGTSQATLERDDIALLNDANLRGVVSLVGSAAHGVGYGVHMLVVARRPLARPASLAWPTHGRIAYIQDEQLTFRLVPPQARTRADQTLLLYPDPSWPLTVLYRVEGPHGAAAGVAFTWSEHAGKTTAHPPDTVLMLASKIF